jgi:hypothetical protein
MSRDTFVENVQKGQTSAHTTVYTCVKTTVMDPDSMILEIRIRNPEEKNTF